jgi:hypothetical protein
LRDPIPNPGYTLEDDIAFLILPFSSAPTASDNATAAAAAILVTPANKLATDVDGGAVLGATQGAVQFGQVKILADVNDEGALHVENTKQFGIGFSVKGGTSGYGQVNEGGAAGMRNKGGATGLYNDGNVQGVLNYSSNGAAVIGIDAVGTRTAIGIATANLDTQLAAVAKTGADGDTLETLSVQLDAIVPLTAQETRDAMKLAPTAGTPDTDSIDKHLDDILEDTGKTLPGLLAGAGSTAYSNTVTDQDSNPLDGVEVWITSDSGGVSTVASTTTNTLGAFTVYLDPGTYYLWLAKGGYNFGNPTTITVS